MTDRDADQTGAPATPPRAAALDRRDLMRFIAAICACWVLSVPVGRVAGDWAQMAAAGLLMGGCAYFFLRRAILKAPPPRGAAAPREES